MDKVNDCDVPPGSDPVVLATGSLLRKPHREILSPSLGGPSQPKRVGVLLVLTGLLDTRLGVRGWGGVNEWETGIESSSKHPEESH